MLRCTNCQAEAQLDATTRQVRYITIPKPYEQFEEALKDKWLTRRQTFEATELKPLPTVVFFPIVVSLVALCALFGLIGIVLAVRPGMGTTRQIIDEAYAKQNGIALPQASPLATPLTPTLTTTLEVSPAVPLSGTVQVTDVVALTPSPQPVVAPTVDPSTPPAQPPQAPTPIPTPQPPPSIPTRPPTFTPVAPPAAQPSPTLPVALPTPTSTATPVLNSPLPTPLATRTATATSTSTLVPGQVAAFTPTPTATGTGTATPQNGAVLITGSIGISNVVYLGTASFNEGDESIDLFNRSAALANLTGYKLRVGQAIYNLPTNFQIAASQGCRIYTSVIPSGDAPAPYNGCGGKFSFSNLGYPNGNPAGIWPNAAGTRVELLDSTNVVVAYFGY